MKHKKVVKATERISNTQSVNPAINFTFDSPTNTIKGLAIRRKAKNAQNSINRPKKQDNAIPVETAVKSNSQQQATNIKRKRENAIPVESAVKSDSQQQAPNIKRKHKKDKQKALAAVRSDETAVKVTQVKPPPKEFALFNVKPQRTYIETRTGKSVSEDVFTGSKFSDLSIHKYLVSNLEKINFTTLTTVQAKAIPVILSGKDALVRSQTGSGKTLAYAVPIMDALQSISPRIQRKDGVQAVIVVPTRELALQTHELFNKINSFQWIVTGRLCGGENRKTEKDRLRKGVHILIGTPGRLLDHVLHTSAIKIDNVRCLVLDEADRLLDMGFRKDLIKLVEELDRAKTNSSYNPMEMLRNSEDNDEEIVTENFPLRDTSCKRRQTILLSATLTDAVSELANFTMTEHVSIDALDSTLNSNNSLIIPNTVRQNFILTHPKHRLFTLSALLISKQKSKIFVFMASTQMVEFHYELFTNCLVKMPVNRGKTKRGNVVIFEEDNDDSDYEQEEEVVLDTLFLKLHGNMDQANRKEVFTTFREAKSGVLLCTDVAARGLDVPAADCIIQYTGPQTNEDYLHRVGRTGRAGKVGSAIIFLTHEEQDYITLLNDHRVFLKQCNTSEILKCLCDIMQESDQERAAEVLQRHYETSVVKSKELHYSGCLAFSSWSRYYNTYPRKLREIFDFKKINLGHYATGFALRDTPSAISRIVKQKVGNKESPRLNKKLANYPEEKSSAHGQQLKQKRSVSVITSEYASGLEPVKKKRKKAKESLDIS